MTQEEEKPALLTLAELRTLEGMYDDLTTWIDRHQNTLNNLVDSDTRGFLMGAVAALDPGAQWERRYQQRKEVSRARSLANLAKGRTLRAAQAHKEGRQP